MGNIKATVKGNADPPKTTKNSRSIIKNNNNKNVTININNNNNNVTINNNNNKNVIININNNNNNVTINNNNNNNVTININKKKKNGNVRDGEKPGADFSDNGTRKPEKLPVPTVVLKIPLHCKCSGCINGIKKAFNKIEGVEKVKVDAEEELVTVKGTMDSRSLPSLLEKKLWRCVKLVPPSEDKDKDKDKRTRRGAAAA